MLARTLTSHVKVHYNPCTVPILIVHISLYSPNARATYSHNRYTWASTDRRVRSSERRLHGNTSITSAEVSLVWTRGQSSQSYRETAGGTEAVAADRSAVAGGGSQPMPGQFEVIAHSVTFIIGLRIFRHKWKIAVEINALFVTPMSPYRLVLARCLQRLRKKLIFL